MGQGIRLHGGPWHGREIVIQDGANSLVIRQPIVGLLNLPPWGTEAELADTPIQHRDGTYSRAHKSDTDFEWDGWKT